MTRSISAKTSLDSLKKEAKRWLKALRAGDPTARQRYEEARHHHSAEPTLREVQQALAREYGVESWAALKTALEDMVTSSRTEADRADDFLELACLHYGVTPGSRSHSGYPESPERRRRAARILERHPEVAHYNLHTAVVCGDRDEVARRLAERSDSARQRGGREGWEPLLFLCYGRLPIPAARDNALAIATALFDHGADPNSAWFSDWNNSPMPWSALCGVIGDGEKGPVISSPHPLADALATLLLDRGADPNQGQALYNTMIRGDDDHWLRVLIGRGLGPRHPISWEPSKSKTIFEYLLSHAITKNQVVRARLLLEHGAPPAPTEGRSFFEQALLHGSVEMAELLARYGATRTELTGADAFRAACAQLDEPAARRLLAESPELIAQANALLAGGVASGDLVDVARLLLDLGASPDAAIEGPGGRYRALHQAACANSIRVAELLIQSGADVECRDTGNRATPLAWALHVHMDAAIELLTLHTRDVFTLVAGGCLERLRNCLQENRAAANAKTEERLGLGRIGADPGETPLFVLPGDEDLAIDVADLLLSFGADRTVRNRAGQTPADKARARGLLDVADWLSPP